MPSTIRTTHCQLEGMITKPPKKRTLHAQARKNRKNRGLLKDVVVKVHKVPKSVKNMQFQHDRAQKPVLNSKPPPSSTAAQPASSTASRKRKSASESGSNQEAPANKKLKAEHTTTAAAPSSSDTAAASPNATSTISRKRKADDVDEEPASKKLKTATTDAGDKKPQVPTKSPYILKDNGTHRTCFLDLAAELRNKIYTQAMDERLNINPRQAWGNEHPLQRTCKLIRSESNLLFHYVTSFQTNKLKHAFMFLHSRTREQKRSLASLRVSVPTATRADEHTLRSARRALYGFKRTFNRKGVQDTVVQMQLPVYDPNHDKTESQWVSVKELPLYEMMAGRRRNGRGGWERIQVTVKRPDDNQS
ncbi:hypothetical protein M409DRAFT_23780 [Zasmidium cellare ATCC 36951]|uniref:Uncharacterized protein n=1 Tax=Zasmidium cellare ATCC 36951 TaxID=1080233 RepID=A0A6A6CJC0_ZASCE|nr:uncharacterized protein M409DRAFT_23780 [Zasmidium cellare ATCC 36951]KAF2166052.1 hypothetical protein M409DRAFT_23780 [Zasmidium cellare ATCC 36951]